MNQTGSQAKCAYFNKLKKKPLITEWVVFCILMVSFSVYYLGVYMFLGLMNSIYI